MTALKDSFTSTGHKFFVHQEAMAKLRNGQGQPVVTHIMPTDRCQHMCSFCSVATRDGNTLPLRDMLAYIDILMKYGLKAVIISGGGNPILYKCPATGANFNHLVENLYGRDLEIGLITNGMPMKPFGWMDNGYILTRKSWASVHPRTLDKLTWVRISMSGLDHEEHEVFVPDIDRAKTTLGMSYVAHDSFAEPAHRQHGQVSTKDDLVTVGRYRAPIYFTDRIDELTREIAHYVETYHPRYVRLLPDCLAPQMIDERCAVLQKMADAIDPDVVFVQHKPPASPHACYLGYIHPVLNSDGFVFPCDSVTLAAAEVGYRTGHPEHKFKSQWAICHWSEIASIYEKPVESLIKNPSEICRGCVFTRSNAILEGVRDGTIEPTPPAEMPQHPNFV